MTITYVLCALLGYLLGSIPFGLVLTKLAKTEDIRKIGSGSIGATNVLRTGRKDLAILTIILDALKAGFAAYLASRLTPEVSASIFGWFIPTNIIAGFVAGLAGIVGHSFPVWLKFKGGKGVASAFGLILVYTPIIALLALATWLVVALISRYSSLSAIIAASLVPFYTHFFSMPVYNFFYVPLVIFVLIRHHANFKRLIKGEESKIKLKKAK